MTLENRTYTHEKLDNLSLEGEELEGALSSLAWVNKWLGNHRTMIQSVEKIIQDHPEQSHFQIIDLGCGGGDVALALAKSLSKINVDFSIIGLDGNPHSLKYAQQCSRHFPEIGYEQADILRPDFELPECDILISSHFLYHFKPDELKQFLAKNMKNVSLAFVNSGLERNEWAFHLFKAFGFIMPLSKLAKEDGLLAIKRAFTKQELIHEIASLPNLHTSVQRVPFFRLKTIISHHKHTFLILLIPTLMNFLHGYTI